MSWIVVNVTRGLFDGHYAGQHAAEASGEYWAERCPNDRIVVCEITKRFGTVGIDNDRFMARVLYEEECAGG